MSRTLRFLLPILALAMVGSASASVLGVVGVSAGDPCSVAGPAAPVDGEPFGYFDGNGLTGGNTASGVVPMVGWALADDGVAAVELAVDGAIVGRAQYGLSRPGVSAIYPGYPNSALPGFVFRLDSSQYLNGEHDVTAWVVSNSGAVRELNTIQFQFNNNTHNLRPFGTIEAPTHNAQVFGSCESGGADRRYTVISGWALDAGVENNDHGIGYVELLLDGVIHANSRRDCRHSLETGAFSNCYGLPRQDIEERYPLLKDSPNAGFRFVLDVGALIDFGWAEGHHTLTVRAGDLDSQINNIDSINVVFICDNFVANEGSFGLVDGPPEIRNRGQFSGWALDREGVQRVKVFVDGQTAGDATYGFPRPEVTSLYPGYPDSSAPGFAYQLDTGSLAQGPHSVLFVVEDLTGRETVLGKVTVQFDP